ncbi:hypothetical protein KIH39_05715 [Telmatocola sphagniphila]|uniref:DNA ligase D 3'-phosphoesterase domain-containing protein n=1 Tax=Telmatocola sphagniphila TaxID=1123043 RepID=A0A8E6BAI4_9BACT|nr:DNA polymerase ligase N-terminal domain-containing protein [Telmatocola sphagniphila]QVL33410.1 hypothetical protein KIH39_05715 [Telmatocola sphagniphila]
MQPIPEPRFTISEHDWPTLHWDLFLEVEAVLWSWRLLADPRASTVIPVERTTDHRKLYLDYEGPVSDNRGTVRIIETGRFRPTSKFFDQFELKGKSLSGLWRFACIEGSECLIREGNVKSGELRDS